MKKIPKKLSKQLITSALRGAGIGDAMLDFLNWLGKRYYKFKKTDKEDYLHSLSSDIHIAHGRFTIHVRNEYGHAIHTGSGKTFEEMVDSIKKSMNDIGDN